MNYGRNILSVFSFIFISELLSRMKIQYFCIYEKGKCTGVIKIIILTFEEIIFISDHKNHLCVKIVFDAEVNKSQKCQLN